MAQSTTAVALADKAYTEAQLEAEVLEREMYQLNHECTLHDLQSQLEVGSPGLGVAMLHELRLCLVDCTAAVPHCRRRLPAGFPKSGSA